MPGIRQKVWGQQGGRGKWLWHSTEMLAYGHLAISDAHLSEERYRQ